MEKYIKKTLISILNQSFQNFEIIIVNDYSNDESEKIIKQLQLKDTRIKLINHKTNSGVYASRADAIFTSKGKFLILMDSDDKILNQKLLEEFYNYNLENNIDIIEYTVICYFEEKLSLRSKKYYYHYHNFTKNIIYQPELSNLFFRKKNKKGYKWIFCRVIWNKIIRRKILLNSIIYIGKYHYKKFFITAEDTLINIISLYFAKN